MMTCFVPRDIEPGFLTKDAFTTVMKSLSFLYSICYGNQAIQVSSGAIAANTYYKAPWPHTCNSMRFATAWLPEAGL